MIEGDSFICSSSLKTPGPREYIFCDSVLPSDGFAVVVCTQLRTTCGDNSLTCRRSNDLEPVSCRLRRPRRPACSSLQVTGPGPSAPSALVLRRVSAASLCLRPTRCGGDGCTFAAAVGSTTFSVHPARSQELSANLAMGTSQRSLRGRMVEIALHGGFSWPSVHPSPHLSNINLEGAPTCRSQGWWPGAFGFCCAAPPRHRARLARRARGGGYLDGLLPH